MNFEHLGLESFENPRLHLVLCGLRILELYFQASSTVLQMTTMNREASNARSTRLL